eukprot:2123933-Pyramimonas_sp.AAC.1
MSENIHGAIADEVLTSGEKGSAPLKCQIYYYGEGAPRRQGLPQGVKDDDEYQAPRSPTTVMRLTCAKKFADDDVFGRASQKPASLPSIVFNAELCKHIVRTKGALNYESEIAMLLITKTDAIP